MIIIRDEKVEVKLTPETIIELMTIASNNNGRVYFYINNEGNLITSVERSNTNKENLNFEDLESFNQDLSFYETIHFLQKNNKVFDKLEMKLINDKNRYTNIGLMFSDQSPYSIIVNDLNSNEINSNTRKVYTGSIFNIIENVLEYIKEKNLRAVRVINNTINREQNLCDYSIEEIGEAILNAIIHRDYEIHRSIVINLFNFKMEINSPGGFVSNFTHENLKSGFQRKRNPKLADLLKRYFNYNFGGLSVKTIIERYNNNENKPMFDVINGTFYAVFYNKNYNIKITNLERVYNIILRKEKISKNDIMNELRGPNNILNINEKVLDKLLKKLIDYHLINKEDPLYSSLEANNNNR